ncbi:MAG: M10 family metallopeptidase [Desulfuromonadales bacterium]
MPLPNASSNATKVSDSGSLKVDALVEGHKWGGTQGNGVTLTFSFPYVSGGAVFLGSGGQGDYSKLNENLATYHYGLDATEQAAVRSVLQTWGSVANIKFQEVSDTAAAVGDIRVAFTSATSSSGSTSTWGWAYAPNGSFPMAGDIWIRSTITSAEWKVGSSNFTHLLHETGHALGLKHPFDDSPVLPASLDSDQYTLMSYTSHPHSTYRSIITNTDGSLTLKFPTITPDTPMVYDIAAIQYMYGANMSYRTGNDLYTFDPDTPFFRTIWDAGGNDTISVSNFTKGCIIDLQEGHYSKITIEPEPLPSGIKWKTPPQQPTYDGTDNLAIAYGCIIENATGGSGNDTLIGNDYNNKLTGGPGNDTLIGGGGIDTAVYSGNRSSYKVTRSGTGMTVSGGGDGSDTLSEIERLAFYDVRVALDLDGGAGTAAKLLGAVFGVTAVSNKSYVGVVLGVLDSGVGYQDLMSAAINVAGAKTPQQIASLLWTNVVGSTPTQEQSQILTNALSSGMTPGQLGVVVADTALNQQHINLVGLSQTGIEYVV